MVKLLAAAGTLLILPLMLFYSLGPIDSISSLLSPDTKSISRETYTCTCLGGTSLDSPITHGLLYGGRFVVANSSCSVYADLDLECLRPTEALQPYRIPVTNATDTGLSGAAHNRPIAVFGRLGADETFEHSIPNAWMAASPRHPFFLLPWTRGHGESVARRHQGVSPKTVVRAPDRGADDGAYCPATEHSAVEVESAGPVGRGCPAAVGRYIPV